MTTPAGREWTLTIASLWRQSHKAIYQNNVTTNAIFVFKYCSAWSDGIMSATATLVCLTRTPCYYCSHNNAARKINIQYQQTVMDTTDFSSSIHLSLFVLMTWHTTFLFITNTHGVSQPTKPQAVNSVSSQCVVYLDKNVQTKAWDYAASRFKIAQNMYCFYQVMSMSTRSPCSCRCYHYKKKFQAKHETLQHEVLPELSTVYRKVTTPAILHAAVYRACFGLEIHVSINRTFTTFSLNLHRLTHRLHVNH